MPPAIRSVPYAPPKYIDFIGKKKSCKSGATFSSSSKKPILEALESEQMQFLNALALCPGAKPGVLAITLVTVMHTFLRLLLLSYLWYSPTFTSQISLV